MKHLEILMPTEIQNRNVTATFILEEEIAPTVLNEINDENDNGVNMSMSEEDNPLQNYKLIERRGAGSFGEVWKALNIKTDKIVALKFINVRSKEIADAIQKEVQILENISKPKCHPFLACYYSHFYDRLNRRYVIEMEYIEGEELQVWARKFSLEDVQKYSVLLAADLIEALKFLKSKNIIYRDIKPGNILITKDNVPKLVDFGISCLTKKCFVGWPCYNGRSETPYFMAPETIEISQSYFSSDIWSLGVTLFYLGSGGQYPFDFGPNDNEFSILNRIIKNEPKVLITPNYILNRIVNGSVVKNPLERFTLENLTELVKY